MKTIRRLLLLIFILCAVTVFALCADSSEHALKNVRAELYVQTATCDEPTVSAVLSVTDVPLFENRICTVEWFRDGVPISQKQSFLLCKGAFSVCRFSVVFSESTPPQTVITAVISCADASRCFSETVTVQNRDGAFYERLKTLKYPYRIDVSRLQNVVLVWAQDESGQYSLLQNAFVCSTGKATPRGVFFTGERKSWQTLFGSEETDYAYVYGQYATRITGNILFHSVPYYSRDPSDLETAQYNLLGSRASQGCVRLTVEAAKWIFDHVPSWTEVSIVDRVTLPVKKPVSVKLPLADLRSGWDPTDPDEKNPWKNSTNLSS